jgi:hypothetical protein
MAGREGIRPDPVMVTMALPMASVSTRLRQELDVLMSMLSASRRQRLWDNPDLHRLYPRYLVMLHTVMRASVPLMAVARTAALARQETDPVAGPLADYFSDHIPEELGHDEWVLADLGRLGVARSAVLEHVPTPSVAALVGAQYYYIAHHRPVALLGYIAVLEGFPPPERLAADAAARTGYPLAAFRTMRKHASLDPHHRDHLYHLIDSLPLAPSDLTVITTNAMATAGRASAIMDEIVAGHPMTIIHGETGQA